MTPSVDHYYSPVLASISLTIIATLVVRALASRFGVVARPSRDRWHRGAVPLLGGVALWSSTMAVTLMLVSPGALGSMLAVAAGATGAFLIGVVDDLVPLKPATKLTGQIATGCLAIALGASGTWTGMLAVDALFTLAWFVVITNAFNLLDNMDGLCAGIGAIAAAWVCVDIGDPASPALAYAAALTGACVGFLVFNFGPASIFMGDSGSLFIGASMALLALDARSPQQSGILVSLAVPVLLLMIPLFDTLFVTMSRKLAARSPAAGGNDHTSHRLVALGFSERQAVLILYVFAAVGGGSAIALQTARFRATHVVVALLAVGLAMLATQLARVRVYEGADFSALQGKSFTPLLIEFTYKRRIFEVLLDLALVVIAYYGAYVIRFEREAHVYSTLLVQSLPVVIACQMVSFFVAGVYRGVWHYFTTSDLTTYLKAVGLSTVSTVIALLYLFRFEGYSRMVFLVDAMLLFLLLVGSRYSLRGLGDLARRRARSTYRVAIYGAGAGGALLASELRRNPVYGYAAVGFFDDDPSKEGKRLAGLRVFGGVDRLPAIIVEERLDLVIISTQKLDSRQLDRLQDVCFESGTGVLQFDFQLRPFPVRPSSRSPSDR